MQIIWTLICLSFILCATAFADNESTSSNLVPAACLLKEKESGISIQEVVRDGREGLEINLIYENKDNFSRCYTEHIVFNPLWAFQITTEDDAYFADCLTKKYGNLLINGLDGYFVVDGDDRGYRLGEDNYFNRAVQNEKGYYKVGRIDPGDKIALKAYLPQSFMAQKLVRKCKSFWQGQSERKVFLSGGFFAPPCSSSQPTGWLPDSQIDKIYGPSDGSLQTAEITEAAKIYDNCIGSFTLRLPDK